MKGVLYAAFNHFLLLYFKNNINNVGHGRYTDYNFIKDTLLFEAQKKLAAKLVTELNDFDNVYFEIYNEP